MVIMDVIIWALACGVPLLIGWGMFAALRWSRRESQALLKARPDAQLTDGASELRKGNVKLGLKLYLLAPGPHQAFYDKLGSVLVIGTLVCCGAGLLFLLVYFSA